jgi:hypothetical protein
MWRAWFYSLFLVVEHVLLLEWGLPLYVVIPFSLGSVYIYIELVRDLRHQAHCPYCRAARAAVESLHSDCEVWTHSSVAHRASEVEREIIAVYCQEPHTTRDIPLYLLVAVSHFDYDCRLLPDDPDLPYHLPGYKELLDEIMRTSTRSGS